MSTFRPSEVHEFLARLRAARADSERLGRPVASWLERPVAGLEPFELFAAADRAERFLWEDPHDGARLATSGLAATLLGVGSARLRDVSRAARELFGAGAGSGCDRFAGPLLVGGFGFCEAISGDAWDGFPPARFVLPSHLLVRSGAELRHTAAVQVSATDDPEALLRRLETGWNALLGRVAAQQAVATADSLPRGFVEEPPARFHAHADQPHARYRTVVRRALAAIAASTLEKVVVARSCTLSRPGGFDAARVVESLRVAHPACFRFAIGSGTGSFLGATPERLVRLEGRHVQTSALAGSAPRGRTPEEDARFGARLREDKKEQEEHAVVVRALHAMLETCCTAVVRPEAPELLRLDGIQHLHTPLEGTLRPDSSASLLDLAARLHPSPAIAGAPRAAALGWLREHEGLDRGWYAGGVGWMNGRGEGELAVALRTVLLRGDDATLHAGAGIVAGSSPETELDETRLKLRAGLSALLEI